MFNPNPHYIYLKFYLFIKYLYINLNIFILKFNKYSIFNIQYNINNFIKYNIFIPPKKFNTNRFMQLIYKEWKGTIVGLP